MHPLPADAGSPLCCARAATCLSGVGAQLSGYASSLGIGEVVGRNPVRVTLTKSGLEARRARALVASACEGLPDELVSRAQLLTSEIVTNALQHGLGDLELRVRCSPDQVL